ncbi:hypothetical protein A9Q84_11995 [Halobacteriovorax marinus]|uniref:histidine kinase n=1 Tax=Halobacteriovorax marinus TaxID=97084 RepID=A0A1Y5F7Y1_9BACT|nr:hypothetical protein A9Q84_11995 [Halobacteriovorax marinus]
MSRKAIKEELSYVGYDVTEATDLNGGMKSFRSKKYDLVIIAVENEGLSTCRAIRDLEKSKNADDIVPIICMSVCDEFSIRLKSFEAGANEFLPKDHRAEVILKVNSILKPDLLWKGTVIAIVEDDRTTAKFLTYLLKNKGAEVYWFQSAIECFDFLKESSVDLVVTDNFMPNMTGCELVVKIRKELGLKELPVVFTSATKEKESVLEFYRSGANDFISKPFLKEEVYTKIKLLLDNRNKTKTMNKYIEELSSLNEVKDQFLAVCSHDLRAPLNSIIGFSDVLIQDDEIDHDSLDMVKVINKSALSLLGMVNDLLTLSEVQLKGDFTISEIDIFSLVNDCFDQMKGSMTKDIAFTLNDNSDHATILGNDSMLRRTFTNLLSNAYKFTAHGGTILSHIWIDSDYLYCTIQDTGIGIPKKDLKSLFSRMSGAGRHGLEGQKSTGIGLSIVKEILDKHNAIIDVDSEEGVGTIFTLGFEYKKGA